MTRFLIILFLLSNFPLMGQYIGIYAKKEGKMCLEQPIFTNQDVELSNRLRGAALFLEYMKSKIELSEGKWKGMEFTEAEKKALKCNFVHDGADGEIEYKQSINAPLADDFYAIGTKCNSDHCFIYDPKYLKYENWAKLKDVESGIVKMIKIQHEAIKAGIDVYNNTLYDFESLLVLYGILKSIKEIHYPGEIALIIAP